MEPIKLVPTFKDYLWGGTKLKEQFNKKSDLEKIAESWELSTHPDGQSIIASGPYIGMTLTDYLKEVGFDILGLKNQNVNQLPILIKFIDSKQALSIQVHPNDDYAWRVEGENGKTEMWIILDCGENSSLYYGIKEKISKEEFKVRIENNTILEFLNEVKVKKGDVFFIEAGTVHAIGAGIIILEIQQSSNSTYRIYDFNRKDVQGNLRELHIDKALDVMTLKPCEQDFIPTGDIEQGDSYTKQLLRQCDYFKVEQYDVQNHVDLLISKQSFHSIIVTEGSGVLIYRDKQIHFDKGDSLFIPAQESEYSVQGICRFILSQL